MRTLGVISRVHASSVVTHEDGLWGKVCQRCFQSTRQVSPHTVVERRIVTRNQQAGRVGFFQESTHLQ